MALINCPDCGTEVSTKANQCPKCARVFKEPEKEGCFLQTLNAGCMVIVVIIAAFIILTIIYGL